MASTINATTSGVVTTGDSVATLSLQTGGTTAVAIDTAQIVTLSKGLALLGSTSGSVSIAAPATAGTQSYTLPTAVPAVSGYALTATTGGVMSWAAASASPGGSTTQVQFNNAGSFAGDANLTFSGSTLTSANLIVSNLSVSQAVFSSATKQLVSNPITGTGSVVMNASPIITSPSLITPALGSPTSGNMVATTSIPVANATGTLAVANGGTGLTSTPANGALDIGNGTGFTRTTLTAGTNVTITNGSGSITIAASGGSGSPGGSTTQIQYNNAGAFGGVSGFTTDGTRVTASTTIGVGAATPSTSGAGITFPATQSASTDVNTLDDYEEGTWTPSLGGTATYTTQAGSYVKIGRLVYIFAYLNILVIGTGSTTVVSGLPFNPSNSSSRNPAGFINYFNGLATSVVALFVQPFNGSPQVNFPGLTAAATGVVNPITVFASGTQLYFSAVYETTT